MEVGFDQLAEKVFVGSGAFSPSDLFCPVVQFQLIDVNRGVRKDSSAPTVRPPE